MHPDLQQIMQASEGLLYMSESDYPFEPVDFGLLTSPLEEKLKEHSGQSPQASIEKTTLDHFLRNMVRVDPNASQEQNGTAQRFILLQQRILQKLSEVAVYRIGATQVAVYIIGKSTDGAYVGLLTKSIET